jgi:16S rRNA (guanine527-N7)-methyltransferase
MATAQEKFIAALEENQKAVGFSLGSNTTTALASYYELVTVWNKRLHLVAPCSPEEFAVRHVLESLTLLEYLPENTHLADIGTGAGLPSLPCLIVRKDLRGNLIESSGKKVVFLREAAAKLNIHQRTTVLNVRFEDLPPPEFGVVACRALDKFTEKLPEITAWAKNAETMVFFGGGGIRAELEKLGLPFDEKLIPNSEQRFLFVISHR